METIRKFFYFLVVCVAVFATLGCTAYLFYYKQPVFAVACLCLAAMAAPYVVKCVKALLK